MGYLVQKTIKGHTYYYEYESMREGDTVRHKFVQYFGKAEKVPIQYNESLQKYLSVMNTNTIVSEQPVSTTTNNKTHAYVIRTTEGHTRGGALKKLYMKHTTTAEKYAIAQRIKDRDKVKFWSVDYMVKVHMGLESESTFCKAVMTMIGTQERGGAKADEYLSEYMKEGVIYA